VIVVLRERLSACLRRLRQRNGWTQAKAAQAAGLDVRHYQKIEAGQVSATLDTLEALASAFGMEPAVLLRHVGPHRPNPRPRRAS
jgi:transcriptional regulator with XRE-family HTH domain